MSIGELGNFLAYAFAPASLIAPLGSTALLANAFLSPLLLKEEFKKTDLIGIGCIAMGSLTVIFSTTGGSKEKILSPEQVLLALETTSTLTFVIISLVLGIALATLSSTIIGDDYVMVDVSVSALAGGFTVLATKA